MKNLFATLALTAAAATAVGALPAHALATAPTASEAATTTSLIPTLDNDIDYKGAAKASGLALPTKNFTISATYGQTGPYWSSGRHTGIDFAAPQGTPIFAVESGKVISSGPAGAYGNFVEIRHSNGLVSRYAHLNSINTTKGAKVERGEKIGTLGNTGNSTGPHLHFEVLKNDKHRDPANFLPAL